MLIDVDLCFGCLECCCWCWLMCFGCFAYFLHKCSTNHRFSPQIFFIIQNFCKSLKFLADTVHTSVTFFMSAYRRVGPAILAGFQEAANRGWLGNISLNIEFRDSQCDNTFAPKVVCLAEDDKAVFTQKIRLRHMSN